MIVILVCMCILPVNADWQLIVQDDFDGVKLDDSKWVLKNEQDTCKGKWGIQTCIYSNDKNVRLINGTLSIGAVRQKYLEGEYTSPMISYRAPMTAARFEMRATMPVGKILHGSISVAHSPESEEPYSQKFYTSLLTNSETNQLAEIFVNSTTNKDHLAGNSVNIHQTNIDFAEFNIFSVEIIAGLVTWRVNQEIVNQVNLTDYSTERPGKPLFTPFQVSVTVNVGIDFWNTLSGDKLSLEEFLQWNCSLMAMDWIRVYQWNDSYTAISDKSEHGGGTRLNGSKPSDHRGRDICRQIMPELRSTALLDTPGFGLVDSFYLIAVLVLFILLVIVLNVYCNLTSKTMTNRKVVFINRQSSHLQSIRTNTSRISHNSK